MALCVLCVLFGGRRQRHGAGELSPSVPIELGEYVCIGFSVCLSATRHDTTDDGLEKIVILTDNIIKYIRRRIALVVLWWGMFWRMCCGGRLCEIC